MAKGFDKPKMNDLKDKYPECEIMDYDELKNHYDSLNSKYDLLEEQYLEKQMPDKVRVQFDTIKDRNGFIESRLDRIEDSDNGKTITLTGNIELPATEFIES